MFAPPRPLALGMGEPGLVHFDHVRDVVGRGLHVCGRLRPRTRAWLLYCTYGSWPSRLIDLAFVSSVLLHPEDSGRLTMMARLQEGKIEWLVNVAIVCFISSPLRDVLLLETCPCSGLTVTLCLFNVLFKFVLMTIISAIIIILLTKINKI